MIIGLNLPNYGRLGYGMPSSPLPDRRSPRLRVALDQRPCCYPHSRPNRQAMCWSLSHAQLFAASTSRIQLGTGILVLPQRDPVLVAKQVPTISHLSGSRLAMAVGVGYIRRYLPACDFSNRAVSRRITSQLCASCSNPTPRSFTQHIDYADCSSRRDRHSHPIIVGGVSSRG